MAKVHSVAAGMAWVHVIETDSGMLLIDAGSRGNEHKILELLNKIGRKHLRLIFITHAHLDHYGSAAAVRRITGAPIAIHSADADSMASGKTPLGSARLWGRFVKMAMPLAERFVRPDPAPPDIIVGEGDDLSRYGLDATVVHTPGHTPGSTCLLVEDRIAFVGDLLSAKGFPHAQMLYASDWKKLRAGVDRLKLLAPELTYTGHSARPLTGAQLQRIRNFTPLL